MLLAPSFLLLDGCCIAVASSIVGAPLFDILCSIPSRCRPLECIEKINSYSQLPLSHRSHKKSSLEDHSPPKNSSSLPSPAAWTRKKVPLFSKQFTFFHRLLQWTPRPLRNLSYENLPRGQQMQPTFSLLMISQRLQRIWSHNHSNIPNSPAYGKRVHCNQVQTSTLKPGNLWSCLYFPLA